MDNNNSYYNNMNGPNQNNINSSNNYYNSNNVNQNVVNINNANNYYNSNNVNQNVVNVNNANNYNNVNSTVQNIDTNIPKLTVDDIEQLRVKAKNKLLKNMLLFIVIAIVIGIFIMSLGEAQPEIIFYFLTGAFIIAYAISFGSIKKFKDAYKVYFVLSKFEKKCENVYFDLNNGISSDVIADTQMMRMGDRFRSNDFVSARYKGVNFEYSDVHIEEEYRDNDGNTHYQTLFRGQWFIFDFNKIFKSNLQICESNFRNAKRNTWFGSDKYKKVSLEDIEFNKVFKVFAQNDLEAFYILTPHMIERIKNLNNQLSGSMLFCFIDNRLHVGLHSSKDSFEAKLFKKIDENEEQSKVNMEIDIILNFIDILNLDNTLFK